MFNQASLSGLHVSDGALDRLLDLLRSCGGDRRRFVGKGEPRKAKPQKKHREPGRASHGSIPSQGTMIVGKTRFDFTPTPAGLLPTPGNDLVRGGSPQGRPASRNATAAEKNAKATVRFAARSEPVARQLPREQEALEEFGGFLAES